MWKSVCINENLISRETGKAALISMPHKSEYAGYKFWHSAKLVKRHNGVTYIVYSDEFVFRLKKYKLMIGDVDEVQLAADEMESILSEHADDYEP